MTQEIDYQGCLRALSQAVSQSVVAVQLACTPVDGKKSSEQTPSLIETMRGFYASTVKRLFDAKKADEALEHEIGTAYGALITHLQALVAGWEVFSKSNNKHVDLAQQSQLIAEQAVRAGEACYDLGVEAAARLMKSEAQARLKAETFITMVDQYCKKHNHLYFSDPHYRSGFGGYSPMQVYATGQTRKSVSFEFVYWDGADAIGASLGALFALPEERQILERFARMVYGASVRFSNDYSSVAID